MDREGTAESNDRATTIRELTTGAAWDAAVPPLRQLWQDVDAAFVRSWRDEPDYRLFGLYVEDGAGGEADGRDGGDGGEGEAGAGSLVGVVGVSVQRVLHHRRHAWVHNLVVDEARRSEGFGTELLAFVERWAGERDCEYVALANHIDNDDALVFYEGAGMDRWGYVVEREL